MQENSDPLGTRRTVHVNGTNGYLHLDLGKGDYQSVGIASNTASLDAIGGVVDVVGAGYIDAYLSNAAATTGQIFNIGTFAGNRQQVTRTQANGDA